MNPLFKPRLLEFHGRELPLFKSGKPAYQVVIADPLAREAASIVCRGLGYPEKSIVVESKSESRAPGIFICTPEGPSRFSNIIDGSRLPEAPKNKDQAFEIIVMGEDVVMLGYTSQALLQAARTLGDLVQGEGKKAVLPEMSVFDYPDLAYRGIYAECRWGPDNMTLQEWKQAIDTLADLRMNVLSIGVHNNWPIQYDGQLSEWLLVPIRKYPKLRTPKLVKYYSPTSKEDVRLEYVPRMYEEDLFGEIVKYGKSKGVLVRPHFNTPGHNTQIPRHYPETSAKFPDGKPKKYGFCMSNPKTFEMMFDIMDEICDRYLLPNGVDWFHIGLDEVYPLVGMNEDTPMLRIDPWCECPDCAKRSKEDHFVDYAVRLAKHLKEKGINNIGMWHDHFARGGKMNVELAKRFEDEGLKDNVILHWWRYADFFETTMPELGLRRWVTPMTGYFYWINYQNHLDNCFLAAKKGVEEGAEGTEAYGLWHPSYHQHFAILGAKAWNSDQWPDVASFRQAYSKVMFGDRWREGLQGFKYFDDMTAGIAMMNFASKLFDYPYLYAGWKEDAFIRQNYPRPLIEQMVPNPLNLMGFFNQISAYIQKAADIFSRDGLWLPSAINHQPLYAIECMRTKAVLDLFARMVVGVRLHRNGADEEGLSKAADDIDAATLKLEETMLAIEKTWDPPFVPQALRELTLMRDFAKCLAGELHLGPSAELKSMVTQPVDWPND
ncbi:MAG: family 20 glycosylhydrolase [Armatimonadetes bacterium]|nr:family 20 glycosylhydrolase [Armatimonadota bacterium]